MGHIFLLDAKAYRAKGNLLGIRHFCNIAHFLGMGVFTGASGASVDEGEVSFPKAPGGNAEMLAGLVGDVVGGVVGRVAVLVGVDAEYGEIAGVPGPHPVVGVAAELSYRRRGRADKPDVTVDAIDEKVVLVGVVQGLDTGFDAFGRIVNTPYYRFRINGDHRISLALAHPCRIAVEHLGGHFFHAVQEADAESGVGELLGRRGGPEAVAQVVVARG